MAHNEYGGDMGVGPLNWYYVYQLRWVLVYQYALGVTQYSTLGALMSPGWGTARLPMLQQKNTKMLNTILP